MKYKNVIKDNWPLISLISNSSIENLNKLFKTHYTRDQVKKRIRVLRKQEKFRFWDKLIRGKPGFDKGDNDIR